MASLQSPVATTPPPPPLWALLRLPPPAPPLPACLPPSFSQVLNGHNKAINVFGVTSNCYKCRKPLLSAVPVAPGGSSDTFVVPCAHAYAMGIEEAATGTALFSNDFRLDEHGVYVSRGRFFFSFLPLLTQSAVRKVPPLPCTPLSCGLLCSRGWTWSLVLQLHHRCARWLPCDINHPERRQGQCDLGATCGCLLRMLRRGCCLHRVVQGVQREAGCWHGCQC